MVMGGTDGGAIHVRRQVASPFACVARRILEDVDELKALAEGRRELHQRLASERECGIPPHEQLREELANDAQLGALLASQYVTDRTMAYNIQLEKWVSELTAEDVNGAIRRYLDPAKMSIVKAGDFAGHPPKAAIP